MELPTIKYEDFAKLDLRVGTILEVAPHPDADKLLVLQVDMGADEKRQIVAGIKKHYLIERLVGQQIIVITNLEPRTLRGVVSHGMLLAATSLDPIDNKQVTDLALIAPEHRIAPGSKVG
jgi:methionine--tRNA ligase beta chain